MIKIEHLIKNYGTNCAVDDISFEVEAGEIVGFLGPNGAGKSTTMNILTGYLSSTSGKACIAGIDILKDPIGAKKMIGYLPEQPPLYLDMTVEEFQWIFKSDDVLFFLMIDLVDEAGESGRFTASCRAGYENHTATGVRKIHNCVWNQQ